MIIDHHIHDKYKADMGEGVLGNYLERIRIRPTSQTYRVSSSGAEHIAFHTVSRWLRPIVACVNVMNLKT